MKTQKMIKKEFGVIEIGLGFLFFVACSFCSILFLPFLLGFACLFVALGLSNLFSKDVGE